MAEYFYETHLHTCQGSACGHLTGAVQADLYKGFGYTGIVVTDHFFNGNCAVPRDLPWRERVEQFCEGYRDAKRRGDEIGLQVFFGLESNFAGQEFLLYILPESINCIENNCQSLTLLPDNNGFNTQVWDITNKSKPLLK